ncbi:DUF7522 family protein [Halomarina litorea]|uniref:DUF7522 family protein n=1 Tax=Halomarina litorea TaxID=2961595 RepID=UPI0020C595DD|nr:hypothetical protein [Halomarina sp. BCD28]
MIGDNTTLSDSVVGTARTGLGDALRAVVAFTPEDCTPLYLRSDLRDEERDVRPDIERFVAIERGVFAERDGYGDLATTSGAEPAIGEYEATIRLFSEGFVGRVVVGDRGVLLTTDEMDIDAFEEVSVALRKVLAGDA